MSSSPPLRMRTSTSRLEARFSISIRRLRMRVSRPDPWIFRNTMDFGVDVAVAVAAPACARAAILSSLLSLGEPPTEALSAEVAPYHPSLITHHLSPITQVVTSLVARRQLLAFRCLLLASRCLLLGARRRRPLPFALCFPTSPIQRSELETSRS